MRSALALLCLACLASGRGEEEPEQAASAAPREQQPAPHELLRDGAGDGGATGVPITAVLQLSDESLPGAIQADAMLVEFYVSPGLLPDERLCAAAYPDADAGCPQAPWCGHCKKLAPDYDDAAEQLGAAFPGTQLLAKIDATDSASAVVKYKVHSYPTLLLFSGGEQVDELQGATGAKQVVPYMSRYASARSGKAAMAALKETNAAMKAAEDGTGNLVFLSPDTYNDFLLDHAEGTVVAFFHAKFCHDCPPKMRAFSVAADTLASHGFPTKILGAMDTGAGGSSSPGPQLYARPCGKCPPCSSYPCVMMIDIDEEGEAVGTPWPTQLQMSEVMLVNTIKAHLQQRDIQPTGDNAQPLSPAAVEAALQMLVLSETRSDTAGASRKSGWNSLLLAVQNNHVMKARAALEEGEHDIDGTVSLSAADSELTALHLAARRGNPDMIALLIEAGAEVDGGAVDGGWSPLRDAVARGKCVECAKLLVAAGATTSLKDKHGRSAAGGAIGDVDTKWKLVVSAGTKQTLQALHISELKHRALAAGVEESTVKVDSCGAPKVAYKCTTQSQPAQTHPSGL